MTTQNPAAAKAYGQRYASIVAMVEGMPAALGDMAHDAPQVHWGHVGDLGRVEQLLAEAKALMANCAPVR